MLKAPDTSSILAGTAFISSPEEEVKLNGLGHQNQSAEVILRGTHTYFVRSPPSSRNPGV